MNELLCCCYPCKKGDSYQITYFVKSPEDNKRTINANKENKSPDRAQEDKMEGRTTTVRHNVETSYTPPGDKTTNTKDAYAVVKTSQTKEFGRETKSERYVSSSYSVTTITTMSSTNKGGSTNVVDEKVVTTTTERPKVDLPEWLIPNKSSRAPKRPRQHADIELQFAGMFDTQKKEEPKPKGPEVVEEIHPVQDHRPSPVMFLETLEADQKERSDVKERRRHVPLDDKLFTVDISPQAPKKRSNYETRRGVSEKTISPESKKIDQPALNLHHLDTLIHRSDQKEVESQPSWSGGQPQTQKKQVEKEEEEEEEDEDDDDEEEDEFSEEIILVEVKRRLRLPKWFVNHPEKKPKSMKCLDADLLPAPQESTAEQHSVPEGTLVVDEVHAQENVSDRRIEINLQDFLKNLYNLKDT